MSTIEIQGEIWVTQYENPLTRAEVKRRGGTVCAYRYEGEITRQIWQTSDGRFWYGDDWYNDNDAKLYEAYYSPF